MSIFTTSQSRFTIIPAVYLILNKKGKYLFGKRKNTGYMDGFYQIPSGHLEGKESLKQALIREAKEEINLDFFEKDLDLVFVSNLLVDNHFERVDFFFKIKNWNEDQVKNMEPDKCEHLKWLSLDNLEIIPYVRDCLEDIEKNNNYKDVGFEID